jgi:RNA polymerase sigma factor for flagellar operon FliA
MATATAVSANCGAVPATVPLHRRPRSFDRRQRLILENLVEVRRVARRICARLPKHVPFDDLVHSGVLGLINAVEKFNPSKNVSLQAYAQIRIRGAILDSLREMDWGPRTLRWQARRIEQARSALIARLGRFPSETEVAELLVLRLDKYQHVLTQLHSLAAGKRQGLPESTSLGDS